MTLTEAADHFGKMADGLTSEAQRVTRDTLADVFAAARLYSSGGLSSRRLRQLGHPYRLGGTPPQDPAVINVQSGEFRAAWEIVPAADGLSGSVVNQTPQAEFLRRGTSRMIARPLVERVEEEVMPRHQARVEAALKALLGA